MNLPHITVGSEAVGLTDRIVRCTGCGRPHDMIEIVACALTKVFAAGRDQFTDPPIQVGCKCRAPNKLAINFSRPR